MIPFITKITHMRYSPTFLNSPSYVILICSILLLSELEEAVVCGNPQHTEVLQKPGSAEANPGAGSGGVHTVLS